MKVITEYDKQAQDFLKKTSTRFKAEFDKHDKYFPDDTETRDIYNITLSTHGRVKNKVVATGSYTFKFGQSIVDSEKNKRPTPYDVLSCLTKYDPESFENFCDNYGYDTDSRQAEKTYKAVKEEFLSLNELYTPEELELLQEIN